jgi:hypothetical protein
MSGPPEEDGTVPTTAAYENPKALSLAAILRVPEDGLLDDMMVISEGCSCGLR